MCQQPLLIAVISNLCFSLGRACLRSCVLLGGQWPAAATTIAAAVAAVAFLLAILREKGGEKGNKTQPGTASWATLQQKLGLNTVGPGGIRGHRPSLYHALSSPHPLPWAPGHSNQGKDPWKLTWVGLLLLSNLFQAAQQGVNVGLDLCQLCLDGLQLTALYWEWREYRLSPGDWELDTNTRP